MKGVMSMKWFISRYPFIFGVIVVVLQIASPLTLPMYVAIVRALRIGQNNDYSVITLGILVQILLVLAIVFWLRWWREIGFTPVSEWCHHHVFWLPFLLVFTPLLAGIRGGSSSFVLFSAWQWLLVAIYEETLYRGLLLRALQPWGTVRAVILSSLLFGASHLFHIVLGDQPLFLTIAQVFITTLIGVGWAAVRLTMNTLWPLILIHWVFNFIIIGLVSGSMVGAAPPLLNIIYPVVALIWFGYGIFLLRKYSSVGSFVLSEPSTV